MIERINETIERMRITMATGVLPVEVTLGAPEGD
jgi:hypothetical protein